MEKVFLEGGVCFDFSSSISAYRSDEKTYHGLTAVDFVVETAENFLFIEVKNPDNKMAIKEKREEFLQELQDKMYPYKAGEKYKSMLLRKWVSGDVYLKPIICVYLLEYSDFSKTERAKLEERLFNRIPFSLNKPEFGGRKHLEKKFELFSFAEFEEMYPAFSVVK